MPRSSRSSAACCSGRCPSRSRSPGRARPNSFISNEDVEYWRERTRSFSEIAALSPGWMMGLVADGGEPIKVTGARVSDNLFQALGARRRSAATIEPGDCDSGTAARRRAVRRAVAQPIRRRPIDHRPRHSTRSGTAHDRRRDAGGLRSVRARHRSVGAAAVGARHAAVQGDVLAGRRAARAGRHAGSGDARARRARAGDAQGSRRAPNDWGQTLQRAVAAGRRSPAMCVRRC